MAYLSQIAIEAESQNKKMPDGRFFRSTTHHVKEIFAYFLPKKFTLDGSSKFQLTLCREGPLFTYQVILGVTECQIGGFDFHHYSTLSKKDQEGTVIELLFSTLLKVCVKCEVPILPIKMACEQTKNANFCLRYEVDKLRKTIRGKDVKIRIFRKLAYDVGESWEAQIEKKNELMEVIVMRTNEWIDLRDNYQVAFLDNSNYLICDRFDKIVFSIDGAAFE